MRSERLERLARFYSILDRQERNIGGSRRLADCSGCTGWPERGVYFFPEPDDRKSTDSFSVEESTALLRAILPAYPDVHEMNLAPNLSEFLREYRDNQRTAGRAA